MHDLDDPELPELEDDPDFDYVDPLEREGDDELPGLDPIVLIPPEE